MAGGKLTPRQKMVNLMYLVFIAMLALNMSKEVLSAFGLMDEKFAGINTSQTDQNKKLSNLLQQKAGESPGFVDAYEKSKQVTQLSDDFFSFIEKVKKDDILVDFPLENNVLPYESMDKSNIDEKWFSGDNYSARGKEIVAKIDAFKNNMKSVFGKDVKYQPLLTKLDKLFDTSKVKDREGIEKAYLDYHYKGFPAIASVAKLTAMQNDVKSLENECYNIFLGASYKEAASMKNFQAIVVLDKNAYFQGEQVTGKVVLGRYDANTKPTSFKGPGKIENGQAVISMTAGSIGEQTISGEFGFLEDGKEIPLKFDGKYVVVPRPNQAIISADKMNVVYRGVPNPISISVPGIASNKVNAQAPGMSRVGDGKFMLNPQAGSEVKINVSATMPDGKSMASAQVFRIKGLPAPTGKVGGTEKNKGPKSNLEVCSVTAIMEDFDFPVTVNVTQFNIKVPGQPTIVVSGSKMDSRARAAIAKANKGDVVIISEIKASFVGIDQVAKRVSPCTYEIQ